MALGCQPPPALWRCGGAAPPCLGADGPVVRLVWLMVRSRIAGGDDSRELSVLAGLGVFLFPLALPLVQQRPDPCRALGSGGV